MEYTSLSQTDTLRVAHDLAQQLTGGDIILLTGDLGAGKTTFTKGIAAALGITDDIVSPTFTLMQVYTLPKELHSITELVHIDTYRLDDEQAFIDIGAMDYVGAPGTLSIIEWPEKIAGLLQTKKTINIVFEHAGNDSRRITVSS